MLGLGLALALGFVDLLPDRLVVRVRVKVMVRVRVMVRVKVRVRVRARVRVRVRFRVGVGLGLGWGWGWGQGGVAAARISLVLGSRFTRTESRASWNSRAVRFASSGSIAAA